MHVPVRLVLEHLAGAAPATLETVHDNPLWAEAKPRLSIVIPAYRHDASPLVAALAATPRALAIEIIVYDDGSSDDALLARMADAADRALAPVRIVSSLANRGRSAARNRAIAHSRAPWILMLDADMAPDHKRFVETYLDAIAMAREPAVIVGGYSLKHAPDHPRYALHRWQAHTSECLTAAQRALAPGRHIFSSNVVAHADVLAACPFDETFAGWGWEDTDWGLTVSNRFPIIHIDNTATHLGLDDDKALMSKYARSGSKFCASRCASSQTHGRCADLSRGALRQGCALPRPSGGGDRPDRQLPWASRRLARPRTEGVARVALCGGSLMEAWGTQPSRSLPAKIGRRLVQWSMAAPSTVAPDRPVVSFTFDDFPKSATRGADIVEAAGGRAGFYATTSFMGQRGPMGEMFDAAMLMDLSKRGHEIGAHTHSHLDCARKPIERVEKDIGANLVVLAEAGLDATVSSFAWPYGETTYAAKRWAADTFATARGVLPGVNRGDSDRAQLRAVELGDGDARRKRAIAMLETCIRSKGWLIFFTHDVSPRPTEFGCSPDLIANLCKHAVDRGAVLATPTLGAVLSGVIN